MRPMILACLAVTLLAPVAVAQLAEDYAAWQVMPDPFPSTGGGGFMIGGYRPVVQGDRCVTDFTVTGPDGVTGHNSVVFDAVPAQGGVLCTNGRWRAREGDASGTTPFRVFIRDGVMRGNPL